MNQTAVLQDQFPLTDEQIEAFERDGAILLKGLVSQEWRDTLAEVVDKECRTAPDNSAYYGENGEPERSTLTADNCHEHNPAMMRFLRESPLASVAARAMRSSTATLYEELILYKIGGEDIGSTPWHQDEAQWPLAGSDISSIWFSLDDTTPETGSIRFVAGSHKGPLYTPYMPPDRLDDLERDMHFFAGDLPDIDGDPSRYRVLTFEVKAGDAILFHPRSIHAAIGNHAQRPRRTFTIRFLGEKVRWEPKNCVYYDYLKHIPLKKGEPIVDRQFPLLWPAQGAA